MNLNHDSLEFVFGTDLFNSKIWNHLFTHLKMMIYILPQGWTRLRTRVWQSRAANDVDSEPAEEGEVDNVIDVMKVEEGSEEEEELYRDGYR